MVTPANQMAARHHYIQAALPQSKHGVASIRTQQETLIEVEEALHRISVRIVIEPWRVQCITGIQRHQPRRCKSLRCENVPILCIPRIHSSEAVGLQLCEHRYHGSERNGLLDVMPPLVRQHLHNTKFANFSVNPLRQSLMNADAAVRPAVVCVPFVEQAAGALGAGQVLAYARSPVLHAGRRCATNLRVLG